MLNTQSAYFRDQLVEKLQLMLATRELYILSALRKQGLDELGHDIKFQVSSTEEEWEIHYQAKEPSAPIDLPRALILLADLMTENMHNYMNARLMEVNV